MDEEKTGPEKEDWKAREKELEEQIKSLTDTLQRLQAEFENFRKRNAKEMQDYLHCSNRDFISKLLPVVDHFELALRNTDNHDELVQGIRLVHQQMVQILESEGVSVIKALGEKFDPTMHQAVLTERSDKPDMVLEELQKGYVMAGKVLRHSLVKVGKHGDKQADTEG